MNIKIESLVHEKHLVDLVNERVLQINDRDKRSVMRAFSIPDPVMVEMKKALKSFQAWGPKSETSSLDNFMLE